ncbi:hypothetical protein CMQ_8141 [Grosmannia clavigera kw1407]|uniref:Uncharacterized protein n=1 Tax=Grosmannia clavigera (strain kw1407 / UAMH 11150) TaxID=655863 RepID=F0XKX4_GROCL|nr:uncharacterized protein CMQ_8141 [Grosmannia clavigera kw1407]EFX01675.1 hypothetical protein CMQ_8141 [Grosmannia clavigera kw1407]
MYGYAHPAAPPYWHAGTSSTGMESPGCPPPPPCLPGEGGGEAMPSSYKSPVEITHGTGRSEKRWWTERQTVDRRP